MSIPLGAPPRAQRPGDAIEIRLASGETAAGTIVDLTGAEPRLVREGAFAWDEVFPWLNRMLLSVDALGDKQDEIRRCPGLFARLDRGLVQARRRYPKMRVIILAVISKLKGS